MKHRMIVLAMLTSAFACREAAAPTEATSLVASRANSVSQSPFFTDALKGASSPNLDIPFDKYSYTSSGLKRTGVAPAGSITDRPIAATGFAGYLGAGDFVASITVEAPQGDIAYFGLGKGTTNVSYENESSDAFMFRIHSAGPGSWFGGYNGIQAAATVSDASAFLANAGDIGSYTGKTTLTITRIGDNVTLAIPSQNASYTFSISTFAGGMGLNGSNTRIFFGSTTAGTTFSNFSVAPVTPNSGTAPTIRSVAASSPTLWPPNGKMVAQTITVAASGSPAPTCAISSVSSNEAWMRPNTAQFLITGPLSVNLRAERQGSGSARIYTIEVTCSNSAGSATATTTVTVPHDQRP